ncbi:MAG TPA: efflux RND transporter permease subunit [Steroidobacteraceae bacterium]|nr:efflux RND transporter permease subunit [Steroidobacteraceae bacterium]
MFLSDFSIKRPVITVVIVIMLMCLGLLALKKLRVNQIPDVEPPVIVVNIPYPGASPETVEREIIDRIEKSLQSISQVHEIKSKAKEGNAEIVIIFDFKKNIIEALDEIRNSIASVRYKLPIEMREPVLQRVDPSAQPIMYLALSSTKQSQAEISRLAEDVIADKFRAIDGVATVTVNGALHRELSVLLRAQKLREYNTSVGEVVNALRLQNTTAPVGHVTGPLEEQSLRLIGRLESPADFEKIVIKRRGSQIVSLGDLAVVRDGFAEVRDASIRNGHPNVSIDVTRSQEASTVTVAARIRVLTEELGKTLPEGTKLEVTFDGGQDAQSSLTNVIEALMFGAMLTILVVYAFLNSWRSTLITALSLPTSVIAAFIAVWACGFTLNFMTLLGLSLAIGVLIDDAIVVRENIVRHMESGLDRRTAASAGTREIGLAVTATTFSIIAVFIPVAFMGGIAGEWFRPFALTVAASVLVSLYISFTVDPMLSAYWGDPVGYAERTVTGLSQWLARFNRWFDHQSDRYGRLIAWALHHRKWMWVIAVVSLFGAVALQKFFGGTSFLPISDYGTVVIDVRSPASASLEYTQLKVEKAAELARTLPETRSTDSNVRDGGGSVWIDLGKKSDREKSAVEYAQDLRVLLKRLVGAEYTVLDDVNNGAQKPVQIQFSGPDSRRLLQITGEFMKKLAQVPGAVDVGLSDREPKDELQITLNRGLASSLGISVGDAAQALRVAFAGVEVGDWVDPTGESRDVAVRLHPDDRVDAANIEQLPIAVEGSDMMVPLDQIATITMGKGPAEIQHANGKRMVAVSCNAQGRASGEILSDALKIAHQMEFPPGYGLELGGASRDQEEIFSEMGIALVLGIALMYLVLVIQFGSFTVPVAVMLSLPLSLIGVVLALLLSGGTLNLMSFIGIIMLMGLVAKNAILLLDRTRKEEAKGIDREDALMHAGRARLRPILMTTFALIAGMTPVAIGLGEGGEFYRPMALAIIGGTITSTLLTLLVVPTFYDSIEIARDRAIAKFHVREAHGNSFVAFVTTLLEALLTLVFLRLVYRSLRKLGHAIFRRGRTQAVDAP